jgi:hypothetical protein
LKSTVQLNTSISKSQSQFQRVNLAVIGFIFLWLHSDTTAGIVRVSNQLLHLAVNQTNGQLVELRDRRTGTNFANPASTRGGLWELEFSGTPATRLSPTNARICTVSKLAGAVPGLRLSWGQFGLRDVPDLRVDVTVQLDPKLSLSRWHIAVESPGDRTIERIRFPRVLDLPHLEQERLAMPFWVGLLAEDPRVCLKTNATGAVRQECDYPGHCSMQCMSFYADSGPGLYAACDDPSGYRKVFAAFSESKARTNSNATAMPCGGSTSRSNAALDFNLEIVHLPEHNPTNATRYVLPYCAVLGTFQGDWYNAATIYRGWATNQAWAKQSRWKRGLVPAWISDTGLWLWNRGRSTNVLDPALALQNEAGLPVSVFWHWWHGCAYDIGFPEYLPPREGDTSFASATARAREHNLHTLVYMNQRLWGMTTASWTNENAVPFAVKSADGTIKPEVYNTFTKQPCATMCLATDFWRAKYAGLAADTFQRLGVDGIYMDQACSSLSCYDVEHGHPPGGGTYWMNGFTRLVGDISQRCTARGGIALAGEGCAENWLPYLDLMLALDVSRDRFAAPDGWEPIPFFHAVYHDYGIFYGNYSSLTMPPYDDLWPAEQAPKDSLKLLDQKFQPQFYFEQARAFVWGQQPTIANFQRSHLEECPVEVIYVIRLAKLRQLARKYLQDGAMLPLPHVGAPAEEIPFSRLSIYAGQQETLKEFKKTVPLVLASAWRAPEGKIAVAVASIADRALRPTIILDPDKCGLPKGGRFYAVGNANAKPTGNFRGKTFELTPNLSPLDCQVFEWRSH